MDQSCTRAGPGEVGEEAKVNSGSKENKVTGLLEELGAVPMGGLVTKQRRASLLGHLDLTTVRSCLPKMSGYKACVVASHAHPVSAMISGAT